MMEIERSSAYADKLRSYQILIDGKVVGDIGDGQRKRFDVESGEHTLQIKID